MSYAIQPLGEADLAELSQFLTAGFKAPHEADFAAVDVLRWKYLESPGPNSNTIRPASYVARDPQGRIVGHIGICRTAFEGALLAATGVETIHIIDWLGSAEHRAVGTALMRKAHQGVPTQFGMGVSPSALVVGERIGYELRAQVPVYVRVLRTGYWMRMGADPTLRKLARMTRDVLWRMTHQPGRTAIKLQLEPISSFGPEIVPIVQRASAETIFTSRNPGRLSALLRFPRQSMTGWQILDTQGQLRGFAITNVISTDHGRTRTGKVVDLVLDSNGAALWHAAFRLLTRALEKQGADLVLAYASTPWSEQALKQAGFLSRYTVKFHIRDRAGLIPRGAHFHLTPLEGDYAYT